jgi:mRNA interferase HigB
MDETPDSCKVLIQSKKRGPVLQGYRCDQRVDCRDRDAFGTGRSKNHGRFPISAEPHWFEHLPLREIVLDPTHITLETLQNFRDDYTCQLKGLCLGNHASQFDTCTGGRRTQKIDPHGTIDQDQGPPKSNSVSPHGLGIRFPDAATVVLQNALTALRTNEQFEGLVHDLAFALEARELSRFAHQPLVNVDIGSHGLTIHQFLVFLCIIFSITFWFAFRLFQKPISSHLSPVPSKMFFSFTPFGANQFVASEILISFLLTTSHIVKYACVVHIVTRKHLNEAMQQFPDAANEIKAWVAIAKEVRWRNFPEVRGTFKDADNVKGYVIFDFRKNRYRLVTVIHYAKTMNQQRTQGHVYIRSFLTHREYDHPANWDRKFGTK